MVQVVTWLDFEKADWGSVEGDWKVYSSLGVSTTPWDVAVSDYKTILWVEYTVKSEHTWAVPC